MAAQLQRLTKSLNVECSQGPWQVLKPRGSREAIDLPVYPRCDLIDYLAQALSAFKAASAEAFVVWAAPTTFMLLPVAGWLSTI
ncbi:hypothetical protein WI604_16525 [Bradyrhizobium symbiodeficiens]|uniref:hypothetical protein n=1 Tax=Bradyrhizobium symbiodeficiens TaxID=1404367 RepID=UPI0030D1B80E